MGCVAAADCDDFLEAITLPMFGVGLATVIPSAPAALGTFELASMALLAILGINDPRRGVQPCRRRSGWISTQPPRRGPDDFLWRPVR